MNPPTDDSLVKVEGIGKVFDVSAPWLNRVLERQPRLLLHAVDGVSFEIRRGETLALVGESGCGKSTVARLLVGLYRPSAGSVRFDGQDLSQVSGPQAQALRRRMQMIFQDPYASLNPRWRVADIIAEPIRVHQLIASESEIEARIAQLLGQVGLSPSDSVKFPHQFSGGQRQRISIARALASEPEFLVCDEPTSALDVSVQAQVLNLMRELQRARGLTYLFISHLSLHLAQSRSGPPCERPGRRDVSGPHRRDRASGADLCGPAASLYPDAARCDPRHHDERAGPDTGGRRGPQSAQSPLGLQLSPSLPVCQRAVQDRTTRPARGGSWWQRCLPCGRGRAPERLIAQQLIDRRRRP
jgi:ABC-type oligopeptide transport system ATPase subunit